ncbi:hypothetical protein ONE63_005756 [Megalurothrips usitatus]|uniref:Myrosinase 1-like n=1 Tax=Megalurothrips usitatus TaxID=439358 RepID=A0AAV7Y0G5_9NEOP|nr:hypothetical protein ONE63_005756 [Megalurothrips usitatus]
MRCISVVLCLALGLGLARASVLGGIRAAVSDDDDAKYTLPKSVLFGAGTSAYQTEGAWDADGKGVNVFDYYYHQKNLSQSQTGDVAADAYNRYKEDIALAHELGLDTLRISLSWARIFPNGRRDSLNKKGVQHYHDVLDEMKKYGIEPMVTIFHFDYPQTLEDEFGGWLNKTMATVFADFADFVFGEYGTKVKYWLTINEASMYCNLAGGMGMVPPGTITTEEKRARCLHHLILGHALAYDKYRKNHNNGGLVGFGVGPGFSRPNSTAQEDVDASDKSNLGGIGMSLHPLVTGDYPAGFESSSRPNFTEEEKKLLKGSIDFAGVNIYGGSNVSASSGSGGGGGGGPPSGGGGGPPGDGCGGGGGGGGGGPPGGQGSTEGAWTMRELPKWVNTKYNLPVFFTESGAGTGNGLNDWDTRAVFSSAYLRELAAGINEDKNQVLGYTMWSFIDTFEFGSYEGWGMVQVDYATGSLNRTLKQSSTFFKRLTATRVVPLVEAGSQPFPEPTPSSAAPIAARGPLFIALIALLAVKWL